MKRSGSHVGMDEDVAMFEDLLVDELSAIVPDCEI